MDMSIPGAYYADALDYCKAMEEQIDRQILELKAKQTVYKEMKWKLEMAIDKETRKASGEIKY